MNLNTRLHILGHVALKLAALAGALGGLLLGESASPLLTALLPLKTAHANTIYNTDRLTFSAGENHACGIRNGALYCWGLNNYGQSGTGGTTTPVPNMTSNVVAAAAEGGHSCAIRNGALLCWGGGSGYGSIPSWGSVPVTISGMVSGVTNVTAGHWNVCAIRNGGV
jgi:hypothetical protein